MKYMYLPSKYMYNLQNGTYGSFVRFQLSKISRIPAQVAVFSMKIS